MEYLSAGTLVAQGLPPSGGVMIPIPRALWQNRRIHFDLENGNVVQYLPDESPESSVSYRPLFLAVTLESPDKTLHVKPMGHEHAPSITTEHSLVLKEGKGESQVRNRDDAEQACREWLIALMEESPKERKQTVSELWQQAEKKWPNLTRKAFHRAKAGAVTFTGALAWAKSGAPRKGDSKDRKLSRIAVKYPSP
jgi:hypothetical protein